MKTTSSKAIAALLTATLGLGALAPAFAQDATPPAPAEATAPTPDQPGFRPGGPGPGMRHGGDMMGLLGFERGAEAVEIALVRLSHALELTTEQQSLLDTLKSTTLSAVEDFTAATESLRPTGPGDAAETATAAAPDLTQRLENRIAMERARLAALEAVQPALSAFYDSLTDDQKAQLAPQRPEGFGMAGKRDGGPGQRPGGDRDHGQRHGGPAQPPAPPQG